MHRDTLPTQGLTMGRFCIDYDQQDVGETE